ncbi:MAG: MFS transporter, partial [Candidatus Aureabacteria bacterium]|nr:MFS transporter [Candidatus Auribacterota bacterium]
MIKKFIIRLQGMPKDFFLFWMAVCFFGFSQSIVDSTFNNFLSDTFSISNLQRSILEIPRELPGLLVVFIFALLFFLCSRRLAAFAHLLSGLGILLIALFSFNFPVMLVWLFIFSVGQHLFLPLLSSIGMELAKEGQAGKRLGQLGGANSF